MSRTQEYDKISAAAALKKLAKRLGRTELGKRDADNDPYTPSSTTCVRLFGSWKKALEYSGLSEGKRTGRPKSDTKAGFKQQLNNNPNEFLVGWKTLDANKTYSDNHVFFSREEIWKHHYERNLKKTAHASLVVPFIDFLRRHISLSGWIYPPKPSSDEIRDLLYKMESTDGTLNTSSIVGMAEIKGWFKSMWCASVGRSDPPIYAFNNNRIADMVVSYRFGLGNSKDYKYIFNNNEVACQELFDISFKQIRRGLEVNKQVVSLFKPLLTKWLLLKYGAKDSVVWDPCAGFGGRLLGFAAACPDGRYVACEPNTVTCSELMELSDVLGIKNRTSVEPIAMEDANVEGEFADLVLTCPPYFDKETYCNLPNQASFRYRSKAEWEERFIRTLMGRIYNSLKRGGKAIVIFDRDNVEPCLRLADSIGLLHLEQHDLSNTPTHLTRRRNVEIALIFSKPVW